MSPCFFVKNSLTNLHLCQSGSEEEIHTYTIENFLNFLNDIYRKLDELDCKKTNEILKKVLTSRITIFLTESIVSIYLSDMDNLSWKNGIITSTQLDKFEIWLQNKNQLNTYETDGFLHNFSNLISTRSTVLEQMDWESLKLTYRNIPLSILLQFLSSLLKHSSSSSINWQLSPNEISESNYDVNEVLSQYFQSAEELRFFQPEIIQEIECIPINKVIKSVEFISLCTVLDTEHIAMASNFRWIALPKPYSLVHFKSNKSKENHELTYQFESPFKGPVFLIEKKNNSSGNKGSILNDKKKLLEKYQILKNRMNSRLSGSVNSSNVPSLQMNTFISPNTTPSVKQLKNRSSYNKETENLNFTTNTLPIIKGNLNASSLETQLIYDTNDKASDSVNTTNYKKRNSETGILYNLNYNLSPKKLPLKFATRPRSQSLHSNKLTDDINSMIFEVTLLKSPEESYGITIIDGMEIDINLIGIFIFKISKDSPAEKSGKIIIGDKILSINDYSVVDLNFCDCLLLMKKSKTELNLKIEKSTSKMTQWTTSI